MSDLISRRAVEEMIKAEMPERGMWEIEGDKEKETVCEVCVDLIQKLSDLPSAENKGEWRPIYQGDEIIDYRCNKCEFGSTFGRGKYRFNFCPNCGADMRKESINAHDCIYENGAYGEWGEDK